MGCFRLLWTALGCYGLIVGTKAGLIEHLFEPIGYFLMQFWYFLGLPGAQVVPGKKQPKFRALGRGRLGTFLGPLVIFSMQFGYFLGLPGGTGSARKKAAKIPGTRAGPIGYLFGSLGHFFNAI